MSSNRLSPWLPGTSFAATRLIQHDSTFNAIQISQNITAPSRGMETTGDEHVGLSISDEAAWTDTGSPLYHHCVTPEA